MFGPKAGPDTLTHRQEAHISELTLILRAAAFAAERHAHQRRKGAHAEPYINHPLEVARLIAVEGGVTDAAVLAAALLHDTIEDTKTSAKQIREAFGADVAALVVEMTDDKTLDKDLRKELQIQHAPALSPRARLIKLADKISNVRDATNNPPKDWSRERRREYLDWTERVIAGVRGANAGLEACYDAALAAGRERLAGMTVKAKA